ncbi:NudC domain-containing protein 1, partial [Kappamyces sp. JEL0680]
MKHDASLLALNPQLLHPDFNGYKLHLADLKINHIQLSAAVFTPFLHESFGFQVTQFLAKNNNLKCYKNGFLFYAIHAAETLQLTYLSTSTSQTYPLYSWPVETETLQSRPLPPTALPLASDRGILCCFAGQLFVLSPQKDGQGGLIKAASHHLVDSIGHCIDATVLDQAVLDDSLYILVMSLQESQDRSPPKTGPVSTLQNKLEFKLTLCQLSLLDPQSSLVQLGQLVSGRIPNYSRIEFVDGQPFVTLLGADVFTILGAKPIPVPSDPPKLYSWSQQHDDVTVCIRLPTLHSKRDVDVCIDANSISVKSVLDPAIVLEGSLFANIVADESLWTLEDGNLITVVLAKQFKNRWTHLFELDDNVLETLDPSSLQDYTTRLEKYTGVDRDEALKQMLAYTETTETVDFDKPTV